MRARPPASSRQEREFIPGILREFSDRHPDFEHVSQRQRWNEYQLSVAILTFVPRVKRRLADYLEAL